MVSDRPIRRVPLLPEVPPPRIVATLFRPLLMPTDSPLAERTVLPRPMAVPRPEAVVLVVVCLGLPV